MNDDMGMGLAFEEARKAAEEGEVPVGAVLVRGDEIIWADHNRREQRKDPTAHAEMLCLSEGAKRLGKRRLDDCTLYVTLEPCPMCAGAMIMGRVGHCVFAAADPAMGCCGSLYDLTADPAFASTTTWEHLRGRWERESGDILSGFFQTKRQS